MITIDYKMLGADTLQSVIEDIVTRDGTDYGESEVSFETKCQQVMKNLMKGEALLVFDSEHEHIDLISSDIYKIT